MAAKDYYQILGVDKNASQDEVKAAFWKEAKIYHPDVNHEPGAEEKFKVANEAWGVLGDPEKRAAYDRDGIAGVEQLQQNEGGGKAERRQSLDELYRSMFGDKEIFMGGESKIPGDDFLLILQNDWGLLAALKKAYEAEGDGKWRVQRSPEDKRSWLPDELFSVKRQGGQIRVFRRIVDWRGEFKRGELIEVKKMGEAHEEDKTLEPDAFVGEGLLCGNGRLDPASRIPFRFGDYLTAIKSLARKLAGKEGDLQVASEIREINSYGRTGTMNAISEKDYDPIFNRNDERIEKVALKDFWRKLGEAEQRVVQVEGGKRNSEGRKTSGEAKE